uniref:Guanosine nucleotide diphosphate dissociation inhibitor n=1 Tax=Mantoniella antarctica TaxID=81844 RepID=A0A7S0SQR4_9CHLO
MDQEYDAIILGTGLKECLLAGLLSVDGMKILHMDRNSYYGGESASLNLKQLWARFRPGEEEPTQYGRWQDWNFDMVPKFMMGNGLLVRLLVHTNVHNYIQFKAVDGSYVVKAGKTYKVPANDIDALKSSLMGIFEKRRARSFFIFVQDYEESDPKTHKGYNLDALTSRELYAKFGLEANTMDFIGHSLALQSDEAYLDRPARPMINAVKLYSESLARFDTGSPYIYPLYGLGELPQGFARLSAVYGGTYMLAKPDAAVVYNDAGKAVGVSSEGETAKAKFVIGDPSYFPGKCRRVGQVVRALCILSHPIPNCGESHSVQIILPQKQTGRQTDMYVFGCSWAHNVCAKGKYLAFVSTTVETANPHLEIEPGLRLLGHIDEKFVHVSDIMVPIGDGKEDAAFISCGYDATTHFETTVRDVLDMYKRITGKDLDLSDKDPNAAAATTE